MADIEPAAGADPARPLGWLATVRFCGPDAGAFLQGQLTADVSDLDRGAWQFSGLCNPKGRLLASFALCRIGEGEYFALMARDLAAGFCAHISKYVLRAKVKIGEQPERALWWLPASDAADRSLRVADGGAQIAGVGGTDLGVGAAGSGDADTAPAQRDADWMRAQIRRGIPWICAATREMFVAQSINFDLLGGVSFSKGCFVGQEVIARIRYRGAPKQRMYRAEGAGAPPPPGTPLRCARYGDQVAGHVVNSAPADGGFVALACARIDASADTFAAEGGGDLALAEISY